MRLVTTSNDCCWHNSPWKTNVGVVIHLLTAQLTNIMITLRCCHQTAINSFTCHATDFI